MGTFGRRFAGLPPRSDLPPSRVRAIRVAQIRGCTRTCIARPPSAFCGCACRRGQRHWVCLSFFFVQKLLELICRGALGDYAEIPAHRRPQPRYVARTRSRAYHRRPALIPGIQAAVWAGARGGVSGSPVQSRQGTVRAPAELSTLRYPPSPPEETSPNWNYSFFPPSPTL